VIACQCRIRSLDETPFLAVTEYDRGTSPGIVPLDPVAFRLLGTIPKMGLMDPGRA
jgi:hypothetical protein